MNQLRRDVFQAIADPTRRSIITLLSKEPLNLNAVAGAFSISRPAISRHMRILTECGLVIVKKEGRERYCHAHLASLKSVNEWTERYRIFWTQKLDDLGTFLEKQDKPKQKTKRSK